MASITRVFMGIVLVGLPILASANSDHIQGNVTDHYTTTHQRVPVSQIKCTTTRVPVYANHTRPQTPNFGEIIVGAAIGSAVGNAISEKDGVGTLGGIVGAHSAMKNGTGRDQVIVGYENVEQCKPTTAYRTESTRSYSHSTLEFWLDGRMHRIRFQR